MEIIKDRYKRFFFVSQRITSTNKKVYVLEPTLVKEFFQELKNDQSICADQKLIIGLLFSGGLRIEECLALKRSDFTKKGKKSYVARIEVLKKRSEGVFREISIHPEILPLLNNKLSKKKV